MGSKFTMNTTTGENPRFKVSAPYVYYGSDPEAPFTLELVNKFDTSVAIELDDLQADNLKTVLTSFGQKREEYQQAILAAKEESEKETKAKEKATF